MWRRHTCTGGHGGATAELKEGPRPASASCAPAAADSSWASGAAAPADATAGASINLMLTDHRGADQATKKGTASRPHRKDGA
jgi:hypothetical protein